MARRRAPGGGRKPIGPSAARSLLTIRMPADLRAALEAGAQRRESTLTQDLLRRLRASLRDEGRDPPVRALCFLIAQLAEHIIGPTLMGRKDDAEVVVRLYDWRNDRFFFRALKIAVGRLLDELEPPGPIEPREITFKETHPDPSMRRWVASYKTPEARAEYSVDYLLTALREAPHLTALQHEEQARLAAMYTPLMREFYGMQDAARDLAVKPRTSKKPAPAQGTVTIDPVYPVYPWSKKSRGPKS